MSSGFEMIRLARVRHEDHPESCHLSVYFERPTLWERQYDYSGKGLDQKFKEVDCSKDLRLGAVRERLAC